MAKKKTGRERRLASMSDVATHAGVSVMTVSNVINRPEGVSARTRDIVMASMRELSYRNNSVARSLRLAEPRQVAYALNLGHGNYCMDKFLHDPAVVCQEKKGTLFRVPPTLLPGPSDELHYRLSGCIVF